LTNCIAKTELARLLDTPLTSRFWDHASVEAARIGADFDCTLVNALFKNCRNNFAEPLTIADLVNKKIVLVRAARVKTVLDRIKRKRRYRYNRLRYIQLPGTCEFRITQASIDCVNTTKASTVPKPFNFQNDSETVAHIVGCTPSSVPYLVSCGVLQTVPGTNPLRYKQNSLRRCLLQRLPPWVTPEDWIDERLSTTQPLLAFANVVKALGSEAAVHEAIRLELLRYITVKRRFAFSPDAVTEYILSEPPLNNNVFSALYDVSLTTVQLWRRSGKLTCRLHPGMPKHQMRQSCSLVLLRKTLPPAHAVGWLNNRQTVRRPLYNSQAATELLGISHYGLRQAIRHGTIGHVLLPNDKVKFTYDQLRRYKAKHLAKR